VVNSTLTRSLAVVTGASKGIGYELAKQFAQNGFDLVVTATGSSIDEAVLEFESLGAYVKSVRADLSTFEGVEHLYQEVESIGRPVEAIAINAGVGIGGEFAKTDLKEELNVINLNVVSSVHLAKRAVRDMLKTGKGRILFTASIAALMPGPFEAVYAASKAFVRSFAEGLRNELKDTGVTVTTIMPGLTDTNFFHQADMNDTKAAASQKDDPAVVARQGFEALMEGKDEIVAGSLMTKIQGNISKVLPTPLRAELHRQLTEPGSGDQ
jgi:uncharacterized protein